MASVLEVPYAKKSLGQHWLSDQASLEAMCDAASVEGRDVVAEVGPGPGTLTALLVERAQRVIAIELDEKLAESLRARVPASNLEIVQQDILKFDFTSLSPNYKIVANIPYYLTGQLLRIISETSNQASAAALLVQKEVAERVAARPGGMSLLSVTAQFYWLVELGQVVPALLFTPPPKVDSQILILRRRDVPPFPDVDPKAFFHLVKAGSSARRKTLLNSLSGGLAKSKSEVTGLLTAASLDPTLRAQNLSLEDWHRLYQASAGNT